MPKSHLLGMHGEGADAKGCECETNEDDGGVLPQGMIDSDFFHKLFVFYWFNGIALSPQ